MFLISHLVGPILGNAALVALYLANPTPGWDLAVIGVSITLFWAFPFLLRMGISYDCLVVLSVANLNFNVLLSCYNNGGVSSPTMTWMLIIPILSLFYVGGERRIQPKLLSVTAGSFLAFFLIFHLYPPEPSEISEAAMIGLGAVSNGATLCYIAMMAIYYARIFDAGVDLETEVKRRRQMADELRGAIMAAHRSGSAKSEFLARMSHEIRTPLNAIIGYGEVLREEAEASQDTPLMEDVDRIVDAARYLVRLINMILDLAKIEAGKMSFDPKMHHIGDLLGEAITERQDDAAANGNAISLSVDPALDEVCVDRHRLLQIVDALLENAARHTRDGTIAVTAIASQDNEVPRFSVTISDTGSGMSADVMASLFDTFSTARNASDGRYGGTGLNMAVCSQLCRAMGGTLSVSSAPGRGASFTISLPRRAAARASPVRLERPEAAAA